MASAISQVRDESENFKVKFLRDFVKNLLLDAIESYCYDVNERFNNTVSPLFLSEAKLARQLEKSIYEYTSNSEFFRYPQNWIQVYWPLYRVKYTAVKALLVDARFKTLKAKLLNRVLHPYQVVRMSYRDAVLANEGFDVMTSEKSATTRETVRKGWRYKAFRAATENIGYRGLNPKSVFEHAFLSKDFRDTRVVIPQSPPVIEPRSPMSDDIVIPGTPDSREPQSPIIDDFGILRSHPVIKPRSPMDDDYEIPGTPDSRQSRSPVGENRIIPETLRSETQRSPMRDDSDDALRRGEPERSATPMDVEVKNDSASQSLPPSIEYPDEQDPDYPINSHEQYFSEMQLRDLSIEEETKLINAFSRNDKKIFSTVRDLFHVSEGTAVIDVTRSDITRLLRPFFVNDKIINSFLSILSNDNNNFRYPRAIKIFDTFFYQKAAGEVIRDRLDRFLRRFLEKRKLFKLLYDTWVSSFELVIVPIHHFKDQHWTLAVINFGDRHIRHYDSLRATEKGTHKKIIEDLKYAINLHYEDLAKEKFDFTQWTFEGESECPKQKNFFDCGVFVMACAKYIVYNSPLLYTQEDMPLLRKKFALEILDANIKKTRASGKEEEETFLKEKEDEAEEDKEIFDITKTKNASEQQEKIVDAQKSETDEFGQQSAATGKEEEETFLKEKEDEAEEDKEIFDTTETKNASEQQEKIVDARKSETDEFGQQSAATGSASSKRTQSRKSERVKKNFNNFREPRGLNNLQNTCYLNAALQCLFSTDQFFDAIRTGHLFQGDLANSFCFLASCMGIKKKVAVDPTAFYKNFQELASGSFVRGQQHDAQEALNSLLNHLDEKSSEKPSIVSNLFKATLRYIYTCSRCQTPSHKDDPILNYSISVDDDEKIIPLNNLIQRDLQQTELPEKKCEECKEKTGAMKTSVFVKLPKIFIIHLKRLIYVRERNANTIIRTKVDCPLDLTLEEHFGSLNSGTVIPQNYKLFAVCQHIGANNRGHYVAYAKCSTENEAPWYHFNDENVTEVVDDKQFKLAREQASFLFYRKSDSSASSAAAVE